MVKKITRLLTLISPTSLQQGQVLLIVVLVMVVALTVGLSVATRSITNLRTTTEEENSQRAFAAAEAGIERAIKSKAGLSAAELGNNSTIKNVSYGNLGVDSDNKIALSNGNPIDQNYGTDIWFTTPKNDGTIDTSSPWSGNLTLYWGDDTNNNPCNDAALEIIFLSMSGSNIITTHQLVDGCNDATRSSNNSTSGRLATPVSGPVQASGKTYRQSVTFTGLSGLVYARVVPLYEKTRIAIQAPGLPSQGQKITSTGESGETFRKIEVTRPYPGIPAELFSVLFSPAGI